MKRNNVIYIKARDTLLSLYRSAERIKTDYQSDIMTKDLGSALNIIWEYEDMQCPTHDKEYFEKSKKVDVEDCMIASEVMYGAAPENSEDLLKSVTCEQFLVPALIALTNIIVPDKAYFAKIKKNSSLTDAQIEIEAHKLYAKHNIDFYRGIIDSMQWSPDPEKQKKVEMASSFIGMNESNIKKLDDILIKISVPEEQK